VEEKKMRAKSGRLLRKDRELALKDEKRVRTYSNELIRQTKKDLFNPSRMTLRAMKAREESIDTELAGLNHLLSKVNRNHEKYHELKQTKHQLEALKEGINLEKKKRKTIAKINALKPRRKSKKPKRPLVSIVRT